MAYILQSAVSAAGHVVAVTATVAAAATGAVLVGSSMVIGSTVNQTLKVTGVIGGAAVTIVHDGINGVIYGAFAGAEMVVGPVACEQQMGAGSDFTFKHATEIYGEYLLINETK